MVMYHTYDLSQKTHTTAIADFSTEKLIKSPKSEACIYLNKFDIHSISYNKYFIDVSNTINNSLKSNSYV